MTLIETCENIVERHQALKVQGTLLDVQTAQAILTVHAALNDENKARLAAMEPHKAGQIAWKLVTS